MKTQQILRAMTILVTALALAMGLWGVMPAPVARAYLCISTGNGNWDSATTWSGCNNTFPQTGDDVTIASGHTVTVNANTATLNSLTVNGILRFDNSGTGKSMTVTGNVVIGSGGRLDVATGGNATTHSLTIGGDLTNNGTFDGLPAANRIINVTFNRNGNQTISGTGTTRFNTLTLNMGASRDNILDVQAVISLLASANPLVISNGTFRLSSASTITPFTSGPTIPATGGFWLNGGTVSTGDLTWTIRGLLRISAGTLTIGINPGNSVNYITGSVITIEGGTLSIAGRLGRDSSGSQVNYTQSGGTVTVVRVGSTSTSYAGFDIGASGSSFTISGGAIIIQQATSYASGDYYNIASTYNVTGGTLQIGNAGTPNANTMRINSTVPVGNLVVDGSTGQTTKPTAQLLNNSLTVVGDLTVQTGTTLNANNLNLTVGGDWTNNGTFTAGSGTVTFNRTGMQTIGGNSVTAFNNLTVNSGATVVIPTSNTPTVAGTLTNNGALRQTRNVNGSATTFLNISTDKYFGVIIDPGTSDMGDTIVTIYGNQACANATNSTVLRCYDISPATDAAANITFYYLNTEVNGQIAPEIWHWNDTAWEKETLSARGTTGTTYAWVTATGIDSYSDFAAGDGPPGPTAITLASLTATPQDAAILVTWETASELDNVGFNLYRSETADGPYTQVNETLIPPQFPGEVLGGEYEWLDTDVLPGVVYYYKLEDIDVKGVSTFHGPISIAVVNAPTAVALQRVSGHGTLPPLVLGLIAVPVLALAHHQRRRRTLK